MESKYLLGVRVDNLTKKEFLGEIEAFCDSGKKGFVVTPYSEFFVIAQHDKEFLKVLNESAMSTADGIGIKIGLKFAELTNKQSSSLIRLFILLKVLFKFIYNKKYFSGTIKEKLSGSEFIYDVSDLSANRGYKVFFLGGYDFGRGNTGELAAKKLSKIYPKLDVVGVYSGSPDEKEEEKIIKLINESKADILFLAYGPVRQEKWASRNLHKLNTKLIFCLGGTFDFISGEKTQVPQIFRNLGLEGVLRPFISEKGNPKLIYKRLLRGWGGIIRFLMLLLKKG